MYIHTGCMPFTQCSIFLNKTIILSCKAARPKKDIICLKCINVNHKTIILLLHIIIRIVKKNKTILVLYTCMRIIF